MARLVILNDCTDEEGGGGGGGIGEKGWGRGGRVGEEEVGRGGEAPHPVLFSITFLQQLLSAQLKQCRPLVVFVVGASWRGCIGGI